MIAPLPNQLFTRDTSAWIYGGVSINQMYWPARQHETLNLEAVYRFHPRFRAAGFQIWYGGVDHDWGSASIEGGDIMPVGDGVVLVGQGERTTARAVSILAQNLFAADAARLVIGAQMPKGRAAMHLDTVFTFCDRNVVTIYEPVVSEILPILYRPDGNGGVKAEISTRSFLDVVKDALGIDDLKVVTTAETSSRPSGRSGTTATTSSRSRPASSSPTNGTRQPTRSSPRRASKCWRSPARSSAAAAAAGTA